LRRLLEVIACSVDDAVAAEAGGAGRLEVVRRLDAGGLTPDVSLVRDILAAVSIPVRVMLRENRGYEVGGEPELENLCAHAVEFAALGVDGVVLGFLRSRALDLESAERVLAGAPGVKATFHRAFEELEDPCAAIAALKISVHFDRILTNGESGRLHEYAVLAAPEIAIIAGGGLNADQIRKLIDKTDIREFHVGRAARHNHDIGQPVDAARVNSLARLL